MPKVLLNVKYGGFSLPNDVLRDIFGYEYSYEIQPQDRANPELIKAFLANPDKFVDLAICEVPDDVQWHIEEYDGKEWVAENHRTWHAK